MPVAVLGYGNKEIIFGNKKYRNTLPIETKLQLQKVLFQYLTDEEFDAILYSTQQTQANIIRNVCDDNILTNHSN